MRTFLRALGLFLILPSATRAQPVSTRCEGGAAGIRLEAPATVDQVCDARGCHAAVPVTLRNCTPRTVALTGLSAVGERPRSTHGTWLPPLALAPGAVWTGQMRLRGPDRYRITAALGPVLSPVVRVAVLDPVLERLVRECRACPWNQAPRATCPSRTARLALSVPSEVSLACVASSRGRTCRATVPLVVRNCTGAPALVEGVSGRRPLGYLSGSPAWRPVPLASGATWTGSVEVQVAGPHEVWLSVRHPGFHALNAPSLRFQVRDPGREAERQACARCRGTWGRQGILGRESCVCRTRDAGKHCFSSAACESECLFHRFVILRRATGSQPALGLTEGRCAPVSPLWSCVNVLHAGNGPTRLTPGPEFTRRCAD